MDGESVQRLVGDQEFCRIAPGEQRPQPLEQDQEFIRREVLEPDDGPE
jgi:hypothetical protein